MSFFVRNLSLSVVSALLLAPAGIAQTAVSGDPYTSAVGTMPSPYWGYARNPYASTLDGLANLTQATGTYHERIQRAARTREDTA